MLKVRSFICLFVLASCALGHVMAQSPTAPPFPTNPPATPTPYPTYTPQPTQAPVMPQVGIFLNKTTFSPNEIFALNLVLGNTTTPSNVLLDVHFNFGGTPLYWPNWTSQPSYSPMTLQPGTLTSNHLLLFTLPEYFPSAEGSVIASLYQDLGGGQMGAMIGTSSVDFELTAPTPTPTPMLPCKRGRAVVKLTNIPDMNGSNKDDINKQLLFCMRDEADMVFIGVYHRYLQPDWPEGPWWPVWRLEAGGEDCPEEWSIWAAHDLPDGSCDFVVEWDGGFVSVTRAGSQDRQAISTEVTFGIDMLGEDGACSNWGWSSDARAQLISFDCYESGEARDCD